jgi:hypothetical protein
LPKARNGGEHHGEDHHDDGGDALREPVFQTVVRTDDKTLGTDIIVCHLDSPQNRPNSFSPKTRVSSRLTTSTAGRLGRGGLGHADVHVEQQKADAGAEVVQVPQIRARITSLTKPLDSRAENFAKLSSEVTLCSNRYRTKGGGTSMRR